MSHIQTVLADGVEGEESVLGVLSLGSADEGHVCDEKVTAMCAPFAQAAVARKNGRLFDTEYDPRLRAVRILGAAMDAKDRYTQGHSVLVARYAGSLGRELGVAGDELHDLETAGYLHDLGKIGICREILNKDGRLSREERQIVRAHPVIGASIIEPIGFSRGITGAVRHHHEWWNGEGYPDGLKGRQIPQPARILAIVDAFEAMTAARPYKPAVSFEDAWIEISRLAGLQFDLDLVECFRHVLDDLDAAHGATLPLHGAC